MAEKKKRKLLERGVPQVVGPATLTLQKKEGARTQKELLRRYIAGIRKKKTQTTERILPERLAQQEKEFGERMETRARELEEEFFQGETTEAPLTEAPLTKEAVQERILNLGFGDLQRVQKIFEEQGILAALSEMVSPTELQGQPIATGTVPLAFGAGQVGVLSQAITGIGKVQKGAAVVTHTTYLRGGSSVIERYIEGTVVQRAFVEKGLTTAIDKIPSGVRAVTTRFASNVKSLSLSKKLLIGAGLTIGAASLLINVIGTYPFSGFIQEEASQTTSIGFFQAQKAGDIQGMQDAITRQEEILTAVPSILDKIPYANVQKQLREYFKSVAVKLESDKRILANKILKGKG